MYWLDMKFRALAGVKKSIDAFSNQSTNDYYHDICGWAKENIFCTDDMLSDDIKTFIVDKKVLIHCRPLSC